MEFFIAILGCPVDQVVEDTYSVPVCKKIFLTLIISCASLPFLWWFSLSKDTVLSGLDIISCLVSPLSLAGNPNTGDASQF